MENIEENCILYELRRVLNSSYFYLASVIDVSSIVKLLLSLWKYFVICANRQIVSPDDMLIPGFESFDLLQRFLFC